MSKRKQPECQTGGCANYRRRLNEAPQGQGPKGPQEPKRTADKSKEPAAAAAAGSGVCADEGMDAKEEMDTTNHSPMSALAQQMDSQLCVSVLAAPSFALETSVIESPLYGLIRRMQRTPFQQWDPGWIASLSGSKSFPLLWLDLDNEFFVEPTHLIHVFEGNSKSEVLFDVYPDNGYRTKSKQSMMGWCMYYLYNVCLFHEDRVRFEGREHRLGYVWRLYESMTTSVVVDPKWGSLYCICNNETAQSMTVNGMEAYNEGFLEHSLPHAVHHLRRISFDVPPIHDALFFFQDHQEVTALVIEYSKIIQQPGFSLPIFTQNRLDTMLQNLEAMQEQQARERCECFRLLSMFLPFCSARPTVCVSSIVFQFCDLLAHPMK